MPVALRDDDVDGVECLSHHSSSITVAIALTLAIATTVSRGAHRHRLEAAQDECRTALWLARQPKAREGASQQAERLCQLDPRQRRTQTEVNARAERDVRIGIAAEVEPVGVVERGVIAVGRAQQHSDLLAGRHWLPRDVDVGSGRALEQLQS